MRKGPFVFKVVKFTNGGMLCSSECEMLQRPRMLGERIEYKGFLLWAYPFPEQRFLFEGLKRFEADKITVINS